MTWLVTMRDAATDTARAGMGGKALALARLFEAGFEVPPWLVVLPSATQEDFVCRAEAEADLLAAAEPFFVDGSTVAVRSSASDEDGAAYSFAGDRKSVV